MSRTTLLQERRMQTFQNVLGHWQAAVAVLHLNLGRRFAAEAHSAAMAAAPVGDERSHGRRPVGWI